LIVSLLLRASLSTPVVNTMNLKVARVWQRFLGDGSSNYEIMIVAGLFSEDVYSNAAWVVGQLVVAVVVG
jgi:hypothetical protein